MIVGLTGGIGSGKSTVAQLFAEQGIPAVDADIVAREAVEPNTPALAAIAEHFGDSILTNQGELNRAELRQRIFQNHSEKHWLEALLHPLIREAMLEQLHSLQSQAPYCLLVAPLLFENGLEKFCERTVVVDVPESLQKQRALARDGSDEETIERIMASQLSRDARKAKADYILDNSGDIDALQGWVTPLHNILYLASQWPDVS